MPPKKDPAPAKKEAPKKAVKPSKSGGLLRKLADAKEGLQIKLAHASAGRIPEGLDTQTNDSLIAGAEGQTNDLLALYKQIYKASRVAADRIDSQVKAGNSLSVQLRTCAPLDRSSMLEKIVQRMVLLREKECELEAALMNGFSNALALTLDDYCVRKEKELKSSRARYEHSLQDYGVAVRKAQVRLGKGPEHMNATKYLRAAVQREIALQNYERVTSDHLGEHRKIEDGKNLEIFQEFYRAFEAQTNYIVAVDREYQQLWDLIDAVRVLVKEEREKISEASREALANRLLEEETRMVEAHDEFMKMMAGTNPTVLGALFKSADVGPVPVEVLVANAMDAWGMSEMQLLEIIARTGTPDDGVALLSNNKVWDRLMNGYVKAHFTDWFNAVWRPFVMELVNDAPRYALTKPEGMSALLRILEEAVERMEETPFPSMFGRLCTAMLNPTTVASFIGGRLIKFCLTSSERFGTPRLGESARLCGEVITFVIWELCRGRTFHTMDPSRAAQLKISVTITHYVSEHVAMLNQWASTHPAQSLRKCLMDFSGQNLANTSTGSHTEKILSLKQGGAVHTLLGHIKQRQEAIGKTLVDMDRAVFFKFCDVYYKALAAAASAEKMARNAEVADDRLRVTPVANASSKDNDADDGYEYEYRYVYAAEPDVLEDSALSISSSTSRNIALPDSSSSNVPPPRRPAAAHRRPPSPRSHAPSPPISSSPLSSSSAVDALVSPRRSNHHNNNNNNMLDDDEEMPPPKLIAPPRPPGKGGSHVRRKSTGAEEVVSIPTSPSPAGKPRPPPPPSKPTAPAQASPVALKKPIPKEPGSNESTPPLPPRKPKV